VNLFHSLAATTFKEKWFGGLATDTKLCTRSDEEWALEAARLHVGGRVVDHQRAFCVVRITGLLPTCQVAEVGRSSEKYTQRFSAGTYYVSDDMKPVMDSIHKSGVARRRSRRHHRRRGA
jgi:hypothetical protein